MIRRLWFCTLLSTLIIFAPHTFAASFDRPASAVPNLPEDKAAHFGLSGMATIFVMRVGQIVGGTDKISLKNRFVSSILVFAAGVGKEVADRKKKEDHVLDVGDLNADAAGILTANILMIKF